MIRTDPHPTNSPVILILDDQESIRHLVSRIAITSVPGAIVLQAGTNREALGIAVGRRIDVVIQDYQREGETGLDFARELRSLPGPHPPVIIYSGTGFQKIADACWRCDLEAEELFEEIIPKVETNVLAVRLKSLFSACSPPDES